jgi:hypothetical protein
MDSLLYNSYVEWFKGIFGGTHPEDTFHCIPVIPELISMREEYEGKRKDSLLFEMTTQEERKRALEPLKVITFEEYKKEIARQRLNNL